MVFSAVPNTIITPLFIQLAIWRQVVNAVLKIFTFVDFVIHLTSSLKNHELVPNPWLGEALQVKLWKFS